MNFIFAQNPENYKGFIKDDIPASIKIEKDPTQKYILKVLVLNTKNIIELKGERKRTQSGKIAYYFEHKKDKIFVTLYDISKEFQRREGSVLVGSWEDKKHKTKHTHQNIVFYRDENDFIKK